MRLLINAIVVMIVVAVSGNGADSISVASKHGTFVLYASGFDSTVHKIDRNDPAMPYIRSIDGLPAFGCEYETPRLQCDSAFFAQKDRLTRLNVSCMYNPSVFKGDERFYKIDRCEMGTRIRAFMSDGAGAFVVEWIVGPKAALRTVLSEDEELIAQWGF